jgi:GMP synthase (glutamine-hydrolysing)
MQPNILVIQFRRNAEHIASEERAIRRAAGTTSAQFTFLNALSDDALWNEPDRLIGNHDGLLLGGSGELDFDGGRAEGDEIRRLSAETLTKLTPLLAHVFAHDIPTLGICYGHQLFGAFRGARIHHDVAQRKAGTHEVRLIVNRNECLLFADLPEQFEAQYGHRDVLDRVPDDAVLLMNGGDQCRVAALKYRNHIYTTQFHPELTDQDIIERFTSTPGYLPDGATVESIVRPSPHASRIIANFVRMTATRIDEARDVPAVAPRAEAC